MKIVIVFILSAVSFVAGETAPSSLIVGRSLAEKERDIVATMDQLEHGAEMLEGGHRRLGARNLGALPGSLHDKMDVLIKNVDCSACMEAPNEPALIRHLRENDRKLSPRKDIFVTALNCDVHDPFQIWNLISLEPTGTWYLFESAETGECMQVVGQCNPDGSLYDIELGPCEEDNPKAIWAFTGLGEIVNFECFRSNFESDNLYHSTPDIFLEAECSNRGGVDRLDLSSHSAESEDQAQNFWVLFPKIFDFTPETTTTTTPITPTTTSPP